MQIAHAHDPMSTKLVHDSLTLGQGLVIVDVREEVQTPYASVPMLAR